MRLPKWTAAALVLLVGGARAVRVTKGSQCEVKCGNVLDQTNPDDIVCEANQFTSTSAGQVFSSCVNCELGSTYTSKKENDLWWMLYNIRYAVSYCLFNKPNHTDFRQTPCMTSTSCGPLQAAIQYMDLNNAANASNLDFCGFWDPNKVLRCTQCLEADGRNFLENFFILLNASCVQQPVPGNTLHVSGNLFGSTPINITTPGPEFGAVDLTPDSFPLGAKVGAAIGGLLLVLAIAGLCVVCIGRRRRRAYLRRHAARNASLGAEKSTMASAWPSVGGTDRFETPLSQKPLRGWDDSPMSAATDRTYPGRYFSPYSSQHNSPVSAGDEKKATAMTWPDLMGDTPAPPPPPMTPQQLQQLQMQMQLQHDLERELLLQQQQQRLRDLAAKGEVPPPMGYALSGDESSGYMEMVGAPKSAKEKASRETLGSLTTRSTAPSRQPSEEAMYELQQIGASGDKEKDKYVPRAIPVELTAPVLSHPGYGRRGQARIATGF